MSAHMCCEKVRKGGDRWRSYYRPCKRPGSVERDGKWYCGQHDPVAREERFQKSVAETKARWAEEAKANRIRAAAPQLLEALQGMFDLVGDRAPEWDDSRIDAAVAAIAAATGETK